MKKISLLFMFLSLPLFAAEIPLIDKADKSIGYLPEYITPRYAINDSGENVIPTEYINKLGIEARINVDEKNKDKPFIFVQFFQVNTSEDKKTFEIVGVKSTVIIRDPELWHRTTMDLNIKSEVFSGVLKEHQADITGISDYKVLNSETTHVKICVVDKLWFDGNSTINNYSELVARKKVVISDKEDLAYSYIAGSVPVTWYSKDDEFRYGIGALRIAFDPDETKYTYHVLEDKSSGRREMWIPLIYRQRLEYIKDLKDISCRFTFEEGSTIKELNKKLEILRKKLDEVGQKYKDGKATLNDIGKIQEQIRDIELITKP